MHAFRCALGLIIVVSLSCLARADIYRWDNGELIPGTEGITPGPGVDLSSSNGEWNTESQILRFADFADEMNLADSNFAFSWLDRADLNGANLTNADLSAANLNATYMRDATLTNADLSGANLSGATLHSAVLTNADLSGAMISGANFNDTTSRGFTQAQLASTANYLAKDLTRISLRDNDLSGWDFHNQNLTNAGLYASTLTNADLSGANLTNAGLNSAALKNADLSGAVISGAYLLDTTSRGFTQAQLASTANYQAMDLTGIALDDNDFSGWDFHDQNLTNAGLSYSKLTNADLSGANLTNAGLYSSVLKNADLSGAVISEADFNDTTYGGFTHAQLSSTASYLAKDLTGIVLDYNDLSGWDFHGQNLTNAGLFGSTLENADLSGANLTNAHLYYSVLKYADLSGALISGADFTDTTSFGFTQAQLASTASYQAKDLTGISLQYNDLAGWDFHGQNLTNAGLNGATLRNADLSGADTRGVLELDLTNTNLHNTIHPDGIISALELAGAARLVVRDDDGVPAPAPTYWIASRPPIAIVIVELMSMSDDGAIQLLFDADHWDSLISFEPGIPVQLGGTLKLTFSEDVDVTTQIGRTIRIFDWTGVEPTGAFAVASQYPWDVSELYTTGEVTMLLPGDTNGDGTVNILDLNNVRNSFAGPGPGDVNGDSVVDLHDLIIVRNFFGMSAPQAVPEPSTVALLLVAALAIGCSAFHRQPRRLLGNCLVVGTLLMSGVEHVHAGKITEMFVFGDSHSDVGNWGPLTGEGRASNGPVWAEHLAAELGLPALTPGFVGSRSNPAGGNDYAFSAARTGEGHDVIDGFQVPRVGAQVDRYLTFHDPTPGTLLVLLAGHNDFLSGDRNPAATVDRLASHVRELAGAGGTQFLVVTRLHSIGLVPLFLGTSEVDTYDALATELNALLPGAMSQLEIELDVTIHQFDLAALESEVRNNPAAFGFTNYTDAAYLNPTADPDEYVYWDEVHFSTAFHRLFGQRAVASVPEPSTVALALVATGVLAYCWNRRYRRRVFVAGLAIVSLNAMNAGPVHAGKITEMYVFGDSHSDVGNWGPLTGNDRFSNGAVWVEHLADELGLPALTPGFVSTPENPDGGNNYAFAAAETGEGYENFFGFQIPRVGVQVDRYLRFHEPTPGTLLVLLAGHNDFLSGDRNPAATVDRLVSHVRELAGAGGTQFLVGTRLHSGSQVPRFRGTPDVALYDKLADEMNAQLPLEMLRLEDELGITIHPFDLAALVDEVLADPAAYGFTNVTHAANLNPAADPDTYVYWDELHFSAAFHRLFGARAARAVPEPGSVVLAALGLASALACMRRNTRSGRGHRPRLQKM